MPLSRYPHLQSNPFPPLTSSVHPLPPDLTVHASAYRESAGQICIHRPSAGRRAPSLKTSQGQYATLYLAAPSAALSRSLARLRSLSSPAGSRSGAQDPRHSAAGNPNPSYRATARGHGSARPRAVPPTPIRRRRADRGRSRPNRAGIRGISPWAHFRSL
jgi:hypothetical protein